MFKNTQVWHSNSSSGLNPICEYGSAKVNSRIFSLSRSAIFIKNFLFRNLNLFFFWIIIEYSGKQVPVEFLSLITTRKLQEQTDTIIFKNRTAAFGYLEKTSKKPALTCWGSYLTKRFLQVCLTRKLIGATQLRSSRTNGSS